MKILKINPDFPGEYEREIEMAVQVLRHGGVVMHPTETCYGLAADICNEKALIRLYDLKKMDRSKPVSVMVSSVEEAKKYAGFFEGLAGDNSGMKEIVDDASGVTALSLAEKFWPGPLTLVLPRRESVPVFLNEGVESVGVRCPANNFCLDMIEAFGGPLTTTSANLTGRPEVYDVETYLHQVTEESFRPDLVLDGGILPKKRPSTIIRFKGRLLELIREGDLWPYIKDTLVN